VNAVNPVRRGPAAALAVALLTAGCSSTAGPASHGAAAGNAASRPKVHVPVDVRAFRSNSRPHTAPPPTRLIIAAGGVDTPLERLGQSPDGTIQVPQHWQRAGWYQPGPRPGEQGAAVILGHVDSPSGPAVFAGLSSLTRGDRIVVRRADGSTLTFRVTRSELRRRSRFPVKDVYWPTLRSELRLITCGGQYFRARGGYLSNVIVFATLEGAR
jgi:hypothetical protein